jgi:hypothetical protein
MDKTLKIMPATMRATFYYTEANNFLKFLKSKCDSEKVHKAVSDYHIGTSTKWPGATIFWQVDIHNNIRTGKIAQYDSITGEVVTSPREKISWIHYNYKQFGYMAQQCLYGEHLLSMRPNATVGLVESEKSAIIANMFLTELIWVSVGNNYNLNEEFCKNLRNRKVLVYPDHDKLESWSKKVKYISHTVPMKIGSLGRGNSKFRRKFSYRSIGNFLLQNQSNVFTCSDE